MNILFAATPKIALKTLETIYESKHDLVGVICAEEKRSGRGLKFVKSPIRVFAEAVAPPVPVDLDACA